MTTTTSQDDTPEARLRDELRACYGRYAALSPGDKAMLRRCRTATDVALERSYWHVAKALGQTQKHLPHVVLLFELAEHKTATSFSFGRYLRNRVGDSPSGAMRFRRLLASRDRDELDHHMRGILRLADARHRPLDWGVTGRDILWFFGEAATVRRSWSQNFYAPIADSASSESPTAKERV